jgi:CRP-like cAMP-binding protein
LYGRLAEALLYLSRVVYDKNPFTPDMIRAEMASFTGTSRESLTRALKDFQDSGFIEIQKKKIFICNEKMLADLIGKG